MATISGSTVTIVGFGSTTITATQAAFGVYGPGSISTTFIVYEDAIELASNGVTHRYKKASAPSGTSNPYITIDASGTVFAVMRNSQVSIMKINAYANGSNTGPFNYNGTLIPFNRIVTTLMTDMNNMFENVNAFNEPIGSWDTSNVLSISSMFTNAVSFNQPIGNWNTAKVTNMSYMFNGSAAFNQPIGNWDTANVTNMRYMFINASSFNQNIGGWNVNKLTSAPDEPSNFNGNGVLLSSNKPDWRTTPTLSFSITNKTTFDASFNLVPPTSNSSGLFTYTSTNTSVATVSGNTVTIIAAGSTNITATQEDTSTYKSGSITATLTVLQL